MLSGFIDLHCDTLAKLTRTGDSLRKNEHDIDLERMKAAGGLAQFFAMFIPVEKVEDPLGGCLKMVDCFWREMEKNSDLIAWAGSGTDVERNAAAGKMSAFLTVEDSGIFSCDLAALRVMHRLGVRLVTLTWNFKNKVGSPHATPEFNAEGLSPYGIEFVRACEDTGIIVDVSHLGDGGFWDVAKNCTKPFIASHSDSRAVANRSRNMTDDMLRALSDKGGVAGLNFFADFVRPGTDGLWQKLENNACDVTDVVKHALHMLDVGGEDCLALGSDFDGIGAAPERLKGVQDMPNLKQALADAGVSERVVDKIFYGNAMRVIKELLG